MPNVSVLDSTISYQDSGSGTPLVFLHGNPGFSYTWRNVLPRVGPGRLLAPDLIGMGASGKPDIAYTFADHARYLDAWFDALELEGVILVGHDWGGALALDWAARHPHRAAGVALLEAIVKPMEWEDLSSGMRERSEAARGPDGEALLLNQDVFIRNAYTGGVLTPISPVDLDAYLTPYPTPESRRPILAWVRQRPLGGEPAEVVARIDAFDAWLASSNDVAKLLMTFEGTGLLIDEQLTDWCARHIAELEIVNCGPAGHHATEDRPHEIAGALSAWIDRHHLRKEMPTSRPTTPEAQPDAAERITTTVGAWPGVTTEPHRLDGVMFRLGRRELGHLHGSRIADLPFPRRVRDELIADGRAQQHRHLPDSGWVTISLTAPAGVERATELFRLSYDRARGARR